jgi:hypothetical protein
MAPKYVLRWHNPDAVALTWHRARRRRFWRQAQLCNHKVCLAQSVECKSLTLWLWVRAHGGRSIFLFLSLICFSLSRFFVYVIYPSKFFLLICLFIQIFFVFVFVTDLPLSTPRTPMIAGRHLLYPRLADPHLRSPFARKGRQPLMHTDGRGITGLSGSSLVTERDRRCFFPPLKKELAE